MRPTVIFTPVITAQSQLGGGEKVGGFGKYLFDTLPISCTEKQRYGNQEQYLVAGLNKEWWPSRNGQRDLVRGQTVHSHSSDWKTQLSKSDSRPGGASHLCFAQLRLNV